jgi:hypothetical protein
MAHMADAEADEVRCAIGLFEHIVRHPDGRDELERPIMMDQLIRWIARWLLEVRGTVAQLSYEGGTDGVERAK